MYQREELFANLSPEESTATLQACAIAEAQEYTDDEADRIKEARAQIEQGKTYEEVAVYFQAEVEQSQANGKGKKSPKGKKTLAL